MEKNSGYGIEVSKDCDRDIRRLTAKNRELKRALLSKLDEIVRNPFRFKPLRGNLAGRYRVHILGSYVLIYRVVHEEKSVRLLRFAHHDEAYK